MAVGKVLRFALLPEFLPRFRGLGGDAFSHVAFFMAMVYRACGLLPAGHPYLAPVNIGRYGLRHVIAQAANGLTFDRKHIDQIVIFVAMLAGIVILFMQCAILLLSFLIQPAMAAMPTSFAEFFLTAEPVNDIAFVLLDRVFGVPDLFGSCVSLNVPCFQGIQGVDRPLADGPFPWPFHTALHMMFQLYSMALMVIGTLIFAYFVMATIAETAQDGTPFGRRFNHVWAPLRMVIALGLLVPLTEGLNSGQYITLYAAKFGSGFATNGWLLFNDALTTTYLGDQQTLIATPEIPQVDKMAQFFLTSWACAYAYDFIKGNPQSPGVIDDNDPAPTRIQAWIVRDPFSNPSALLWRETNWQEALEFSRNQDIIIRFGAYDPERSYGMRGFVSPKCGEMVIPVTSITEPGPLFMLEMYYALFGTMWEQLEPDGEVIARRSVTTTNETGLQAQIESDKATFLQNFNESAGIIIQNGAEEQAANGQFADPDLLQLGWGGAAIWYNKMAQMNGAVTAAAFSIPKPNLWPASMENVLQQRRNQDQDVGGIDKFNPHMSEGFSVTFSPAYESDVYKASYNAYKVFEDENGGRMPEPHTSMTSNVVIDVINAIFGSSGLFNMRQNADIHPLAQLSSAGKSLIEASIRNFTSGMAISTVLSVFGAGSMASIAGSIATTLATIGITAGFALFYVVPFLPFIYFFFAVSTWIKGIFEAMVGVPLWALAHIRIDGHGLPGDAAMPGYFLIFEIFLRPLLIVFGLLGSILIFAAMVKVLNETFDLVIQNLTGFDIASQGDPNLTNIEFLRGPIDEFFFTVIYVILVYMIGVSSFKMVDLVPNEIMRWLGASVKTFSDIADDPTSGLMQTVALGGGGAASQLGGAVGQAGKAGQTALNKVLGR